MRERQRAGGGAAERGEGVKVRAPRRAEEALEFLYRDPFRNAGLILLVERSAAASGVDLQVVEEGAVRGVRVTSPGPEGTRSVGLDAECPEAAEALLRGLCAGERLQVGVHRPELLPVLGRVCAAMPAGEMLAFRCNGPWLCAHSPAPAMELTRKEERIVQRAGDDAFLYSFQQSIRGAAREDSEVHTFGVIERGRLLARCLTTWSAAGIERQIGTVWSVYTEPSARSRGLGRAVVAAATAAILGSGRVARYFAFSDNLPSVRICHALGYAQDHAVHYFWAQRRP